MPPFRKTLRRIENPHHAHYLTFSCYQRLPLFNNDSIKQLFVEQIELARTRRKFALLAWVIMPEHVHLLLIPRLPEHPIPRVLHALKRPFAEQVLRRWKQLDAPILARLRDSDGRLHFWQGGGGYDRNVFSDAEVLEKVDYIHANPIRRKLANVATDWPWSSARWYDGERDGQLAIDDWAN